MRTNRQKTRNGFRRAFYSGIFILLSLTAFFTFLSIKVYDSVVSDKNTKEIQLAKSLGKDTVIVQLPPREIRVRDTVYLRPTPPRPKVVDQTVPDPKAGEQVAPKRDTLPK